MKGLLVSVAAVLAVLMASTDVPGVDPSVKPPPPVGQVPPADLQRNADLVVRNLGLASTGFVTFTVENQGQLAVASPFVADVYVNEVRRDTVKLDPLGGASSRAVQSALARAPDCKPTTLKVVLDPQNVVAEATETNNAASRQVIPPCPDLMATISVDRMNNNLQFKAKITVTNRGNLASGPSVAHLDWGQAGTGLGLPGQARFTVGPLAPGQSYSFHEIDKHLASTRMEYRVIVDFYKTVNESNEDNNITHAKMGGL